MPRHPSYSANFSPSCCAWRILDSLQCVNFSRVFTRETDTDTIITLNLEVGSIHAWLPAWNCNSCRKCVHTSPLNRAMWHSHKTSVSCFGLSLAYMELSVAYSNGRQLEVISTHLCMACIGWSRQADIKAY